MTVIAERSTRRLVYYVWAIILASIVIIAEIIMVCCGYSGFYLWAMFFIFFAMFVWMLILLIRLLSNPREIITFDGINLISQKFTCKINEVQDVSCRAYTDRWGMGAGTLYITVSDCVHKFHDVADITGVQGKLYQLMLENKDKGNLNG